jgi:Kdo2-lipid IVA lauroyltransferase/acyltransferase
LSICFTPANVVGAVAADPAVAAGQVNARMERLIRECPRQYLWGYARYKAPAGSRA